jgi:putative effector of murein hydrolase
MGSLLMKTLFEIVLLSILYELSVLMSGLLPIPLPPVLIGMGLLLLLLKMNVIRIEQMENASTFFTRHMMFFFIPVIAGIMQYWNVIHQGGWDLLLTIVISTACVLYNCSHHFSGKKEEEFNVTAFLMCLWIVLTVAIYALAYKLYRKISASWLNPIFICPAVLMLILWLTHTNYPVYHAATQPITFFLGPIQLAMVIPLYKYAAVLKQNVFTILSAVAAGTCSGIFLVVVMSRLFHFSSSTLASLTPKSVTAPMAVSVSQLVGGLPELTAVFTVMTALIGMVLGPLILQGLGIKNTMVKGLALGTAASMVGAARAAQWGEKEGIMGTLGMVLSALIMPAAAFGFLAAIL